MTEHELFQAVLDLPDGPARAALLDDACASDPERRTRIDALLRSHEQAGSFLDAPAAVLPDPGDVDPLALDDAPTQDGSVPPEGDEDLRGVLTPSTRAGSLGRLAHYEVLQVLGRGGFGVVFRAFDDVLQRVVAIKMMVSHMALTSPARKRFLREARASAAVRHENVVQVYEVAEQPLPYLVMEFIPGETLQQRLDRSGPLDLAETLRVGRQIAEGLAAAHTSDLVHRDVKPGNVLLEGGTHRVKLTDFGLARTADDASMTQSGMIAGTPLYMAPEQAMGQTSDQRADLFSLGSVLYHMVTGRPPFRASSTLAVMKRVAEDTPRPPREIIPETPQWLADIITKLHAKNPAERFASAREVADVLADCEEQLKANSKLRDFSRIPRGTSKHGTARRKWLTAAAAVVLPLMALAVTELSGVTRLVRRHPAGPKPNEVAVAGSLVSAKAAVPTTPPAEQWVQLFNGKDLTGWKTHPDEPGDWEVIDGILIGSGRRGFLFTDRGDFKDFHLRVQVKINNRGDSGIVFRSAYEIRRGLEAWQFWIPGAYEAEIQKQPSHNRPTGSLAEIPEEGKPNLLALAADDSLTRPNEWFLFELRVEGNRFVTLIDGTEAARCVDSLDRHPRGHLALQIWHANTNVQFRRIEIRELGPTPPAPR
ncbi:MAG TPA: protein kinase [Tepidisphaeraceae bacterium]|nr:protein kinase [Tepidisphaeraceae bacterium]